MSFLEIRFSGRYKAESLICKTKQKNIYRGRNIQTGELVVIKAEFFKSKSSNILYEGKFLQMTQGSPGIPWMHWCGPESDECNCLILEHLGYGLEELFQLCNRKFSLKTVTMIGLQLLEMLEVYHFKELIHRNICPHSFQLGKGRKNHRIFFNDLLNSKKYIDNKTGEHILKREALVPEVYNLFNSFNILKGQQPTRRDDLESMMLMLVYFLKGDLPWLNIVEQNHIQMGEKIFNMRKGITTQQLLKGTPIEFTSMWQHITQLKFDEKPNYHYLEKKLKKIQSKNNIDNDLVFDWILQGIAQNEQLEVANIEQSPVNCQIIPNEDIFLKLFYEPYEKDLELNEIQKKFRSKRAIQLEQSSMAASQSRHEQRTDRRASRQSNQQKQCQMF